MTARRTSGSSASISPMSASIAGSPPTRRQRLDDLVKGVAPRITVRAVISPRGRPRVADPAERPCDPFLHGGVGILQRRDQPVHGGWIPQRAEGPGRSLADLLDRVPQQSQKTVDRRVVADPAEGPGGPPAHGGVLVAERGAQGRRRRVHLVLPEAPARPARGRWRRDSRNASMKGLGQSRLDGEERLLPGFRRWGGAGTVFSTPGGSPAVAPTSRRRASETCQTTVANTSSAARCQLSNHPSRTGSACGGAAVRLALVDVEIAVPGSVSVVGVTAETASAAPMRTTAAEHCGTTVRRHGGPSGPESRASGVRAARAAPWLLPPTGAGRACRTRARYRAGGSRSRTPASQAQDLVVARPLALDAQPERGEPDQGIEPVDRAGPLRHQLGGDVGAFDVSELVPQHDGPAPGRPRCRGCGEEHGRPAPAPGHRHGHTVAAQQAYRPPYGETRARVARGDRAIRAPPTGVASATSRRVFQMPARGHATNATTPVAQITSNRVLQEVAGGAAGSGLAVSAGAGPALPRPAPAGGAVRGSAVAGPGGGRSGRPLDHEGALAAPTRGSAPAGPVPAAAAGCRPAAAHGARHRHRYPRAGRRWPAAVSARRRERAPRRNGAAPRNGGRRAPRPSRRCRAARYPARPRRPASISRRNSSLSVLPAGPGR